MSEKDNTEYKWILRFVDDTYVPLDIAAFVVSRRRETVRQWANRAGVIRLKRRNTMGVTKRGDPKQDHRYLYNLLDCCKYAMVRDRIESLDQGDKGSVAGDTRVRKRQMRDV